MRKLLVANRGEIARRIQRTCREMGVATVAVFSEPDRATPFVREADEAVPLGGASATESYLRADAIVEAARATGADAIHPGYGFLSENAAFARACEEAGLLFVGPSADVIDAMGSKVEAKLRMEKAGVPVLPSVVVEGAEPDALEADAAGIGFPLLVKASAGGGGRGMRIVREPSELAAAIEGGAREAERAFGDGTLYLERYVAAPRHVEVQIFGDRAGRVLHLFERECSIQRRHQKIVEEAPCTALDETSRAALCAAAVAAGEAVGYVGAGTVEFLLAPDGAFYFLEMNTRLQVEHPVTEMITGLDLVRWQIEVARGGELPAQETIRRRGHAIEVRLYAEDPRRQFFPVTGTLHRFGWPETLPAESRVRLDTGVESGSEVSVHYDPMLAKVIASAESRPVAAARLAKALTHLELHGLRATNRELLVRILEHDAFLAGDTDTHFLERHDPAELGGPLPDEAARRRHAVVAALAAQAARRADARVQSGLPSGWRNSPSQPQSVRLEGSEEALEIGYAIRHGRLEVSVDGARAPVGRCEAEGDSVALEWEGVLRRHRVCRLDDVHFVDGPEGPSSWIETPRFPPPEASADGGSLDAPLPGVVLRVEVEAGARVKAGQVLLVVEAMKMEHAIRAPGAGVVEAVLAEVGEQVQAGQRLVSLESAD